MSSPNRGDGRWSWGNVFLAALFGVLAAALIASFFFVERAPTLAIGRLALAVSLLIVAFAFYVDLPSTLKRGGRDSLREQQEEIRKSDRLVRVLETMGEELSVLDDRMVEAEFQYSRGTQEATESPEAPWFWVLGADVLSLASSASSGPPELDREVEARLLEVLRSSRAEWHTVPGLSEAGGVPFEVARRFLQTYPQVRPSLLPLTGSDDLYTLDEDATGLQPVEAVTRADLYLKKACAVAERYGQEEAAAYFRVALRHYDRGGSDIFEREPGVALRLARTCRSLGHLERALELLEKIEPTGTNQSPVQLERGLVRLARGLQGKSPHDLRAAIDEFDQVARAMPTPPREVHQRVFAAQLRYLLGLGQEELGNCEQAGWEYDQALRSWHEADVPDDDLWVRAARGRLHALFEVTPPEDKTVS